MIETAKKSRPCAGSGRASRAKSLPPQLEMRRPTKAQWEKIAADTAWPTRPRGRWPAKSPVPLPLFDAPAVTADDLRLWLQTHTPHIDPDGPRAAAYIAGYQIAQKIARDKLAGRWPPDARYKA